MSAKAPMKFFGYELRPVTDADLDLARECTAADEHHNGRIAPEFWTRQGRGVDGYVLCDDEGPVLFLQMHRAVRLYIQFTPGITREARERIRKGLIAGMNYLAVALGAVGITEVLFDTSSKVLAQFARARLKFTEAPPTLRRSIQTFEPRLKAEPVEVFDGQGPAEARESLGEPQPATLQGVN